MTDPFEHPDVRRFLKRAERDMLPKLRDSALSMILFSEKPDMKLAVEFGTSVLLDKPIVLVVQPGAKVPERVMRVADAVIEWVDDQSLLAERINAVMKRVLGDEDQ